MFFPWTMPTVEGFVYPGEVLTSRVASQWYVNNVAVVGQTGSTYTVALNDIGLPIRCGTSESVTCWHPNQISAVAGVWVSRANVFNSVSPNTSATDGQTVRRWNDLIAGYEANQSTGANQPIFRATGQSSGASIEADGSNDRMDITASAALDIFRNKTHGYLFAGVRPTNLSRAGVEGMAVAIWSQGTALSSRVGLFVRTSGPVQSFSATTRRVDGDAVTTAATANNSNYNVLTNESLFSAGTNALRVNGTQVDSKSLPSSGSTSNTASQGVSFFGTPDNVTFNPLPGHVTAIIAANSELSATDRSRIERYIGLMGGLNIPLV